MQRFKITLVTLPMLGTTNKRDAIQNQNGRQTLSSCLKTEIVFEKGKQLKVHAVIVIDPVPDVLCWEIRMLNGPSKLLSLRLWHLDGPFNLLGSVFPYIVLWYRPYLYNTNTFDPAKQSN